MPGGEVNNDMKPVVIEAWHRGVTTIIMVNNYKRRIGDLLITLNGELNELVMPILYAPVIQLLAYELGVVKGLDVDNCHT